MDADALPKILRHYKYFIIFSRFAGPGITLAIRSFSVA
jgi:hypothetical protein